MKSLLFSFLLLTACASEYSTLAPTSSYDSCKKALKPTGIVKSWYDASVDVEGHHIGGLILIKPMDDGSKRVVFTSESGATIFDFEYKRDGGFAIRHIIKKLNKRVVTNVLRKDFELLLAIPFNHPGAVVNAYSSGQEVYFESKYDNGRWFYIADQTCDLKRLEMGSRKKMFSITMHGDPKSPENIIIRHHTFDMIIDLKKIIKDAAE